MALGELTNSLPDFSSMKVKDVYKRQAWARKMLINISKAGYFSSDRTIEEYNRDIWKLDTGLAP